MIAKHIVLVGAGHAHVEVLRRFRLRAEPGLRLTVIMKSTETPYSGMFPGFIAGHYTKPDINIRTAQLANFSGCTTIVGRAVGLDADRRQIFLDSGESIEGDVISIGGRSRALSLCAKGTFSRRTSDAKHSEYH